MGTAPAMLFRSRWAAVLLTALGCAAAGSSEVPAGGERLRDLAYGVSLYHYYQQQYFTALTELTAAQQQQRLPNHGDDAELLRGGISLSYGLEQEAGAVFTQLLAQPREGIDRDRAWFYLGKLHWRRGQIGASGDALGQMAPAYSGPLADEGHYLQAVQALMAGEETAAAARLARIQSPCPFKPYYFYNLGVQRAAAQRWPEAAQAFAQVEALACGDEEGRTLRDRAQTAAGFAHLAANDTLAARLAFEKVRLRGPESDRALLGYGWSYANTGDYSGALGPWGALAERDLDTASARESLLAIPYAYEQLQQPGLALAQYRLAARRYAGQRAAVDRATRDLQQGDLLALFGLEALGDLAWLGGDDPLPAGEHGALLTALLATERVQLALREYRDLVVLDRELDKARERLAVLAQVDREQRQVWEGTASGGRAEALLAQRQQLLQRLGALREHLRQAIDEGDSRALAPAEQQARWRRLERAQGLADQHGEPAQQQQLRLMRGLMQWQDSDQFPQRRWELQRQLRDLERLAASSAAAEAALLQALQKRQRPVYAGRIETMLARVDSRQSALRTVLAQAEDGLRQAALAALASQRQQLASSEANALLAVARLYDDASAEVPR